MWRVASCSIGLQCSGSIGAVSYIELGPPSQWRRVLTFPAIVISACSTTAAVETLEASHRRDAVLAGGLWLAAICS